MTKAFTACVLAIQVMSAGCDRDTDDARALEVPPTVLGDEDIVRPEVVIVEGCLAASGDRFVLTELERAVAGPRVSTRTDAVQGTAPEPTTETYRLVGMDAQLRPLVGSVSRLPVRPSPSRSSTSEGRRHRSIRRTSPPAAPPERIRRSPAPKPRASKSAIFA